MSVVYQTPAIINIVLATQELCNLKWNEIWDKILFTSTLIAVRKTCECIAHLLFLKISIQYMRCHFVTNIWEEKRASLTNLSQQGVCVQHIIIWRFVDQNNRSSNALVLLIVDAICKIKHINFSSWRCRCYWNWNWSWRLELLLQEEAFLAFPQQDYPLTAPNH